MLQIRRLINQNRKKILNSILVIVFVFLLIYGMNSILKSEEDQKINNQDNSTQKNTTNVAKTEDVQNSTSNNTILNTMKMFVNY